jgi:hypothetical protein
MARTASGKFNRTPSEEYTALNPQQKRLTWLFYRSLQTHYKEGLDPGPEKVPGGINNWKASGTVKNYIKQRKFRYNAKVSLLTFLIIWYSFCCCIFTSLF